VSINVGQGVSNDRRTNGEISPNSPETGTSVRKSDVRDAPMEARPARLRFDGFVLDLERGCLLREDQEIPLRRKTFEFLRYLASNSCRLASKEELLAAVWPNVMVSDDSVVQCVTELRRALGDHDQRLIRTIQRRGYRFETPVAIETSTVSSQVPEAGLQHDSSREAARVARVGDPRGRRRLIVVVAAVCVLTLLAAALLDSHWSPGSTERLTAPPLSIVVMPFKNLNDDRDQAYFAEGVSNDLSTELSRLPGLFVIAQATAHTFKDSDVDARQVGRALNVRYLLAGSVRRNVDQVRISAQLISAETGATLWAERFERGFSDLPAWQDEVIGRIALALNYRLVRLESERGLRERPGAPEAFDLTMRGWALVYASKKPDHYFAARTHFQQALALDPKAVNAAAGVAWTSAIIVLDSWSASPTQDIAAAEAAVAKALALEPNHFVAHHVRGFLLRMQRRTSAAQDAFRTATTINPNFAPGYAQLGATELELGRPEATIAAVERAIRLSPRDPSLGPWLAFIGMAKLHLGEYPAAASWLARAIETGTPIASHQAYLASALALGGRPAEARSALAEFRNAMPSATISTLRAHAKSSDAKFLVQQERFFDGLRVAGLPE
jgi:TolB-like protein/DNA-binding winged helix-turn-helix (wHTH) protein